MVAVGAAGMGLGYELSTLGFGKALIHFVCLSLAVALYLGCGHCVGWKLGLGLVLGLNLGLVGGFVALH